MPHPTLELHPETPDLSPLAPYLEQSAELSKSDLLHRIGGKVEPALLVYLKGLQCYRIFKNAAGQVILL